MVSNPIECKMTALQTEASNIQIKNLDGRVGTYAISTVDYDSWINEPITTALQKTRKTRNVKEIVNKIFSDCAAVTYDPFWVDKFNNAAMGKFPSKFTYHDGILTYRRGAKCITLELSNNPHEASHACIEFFHSNGGIFSQIDEQHSLEVQHQRNHNGPVQQLAWGDVNKKIQECMLSYYVVDMKSIMNLSNSEVEQLRQTIRLGIADKYFGKHNILVENNRIHSISGLLWNNNNRSFYINPDLKPITTRVYIRKKDGPPPVDPSQKDMIPQFNTKWEKYIESLDKKIIRNNRRQRRITVNHPGGHTLRLQLVPTSSTITPTTPYTEITTNDYDENDDDDDENDDE
jgi:hypothetical protein